MRSTMALAGPVIAASVSVSCRSDERYLAESEPQLPPRDVAGMEADMIGIPNKSLHPSLAHPRYSSDREADEFLEDDERVYFIRTRELTLVYPEVILGLHHVINETIDGEPVAITLCRLTDSAALYSRRLDGEKLTLGSLGTVVHGNDVLYDAQTDSWWAQLTGECFSGKRRGKRLPPAAGLEEGTWGQVKRLPYVNVIIPQGHVSKYRSFLESVASSGAGLKALETRRGADARLEPFRRGMGITVRGEARFYPLETVKERRAINDEVGGWGLLVLHDDAFGGARIFRRYMDGARPTFVMDGTSLRDRETGSTWTLEGKAIGGSLRGKTLERPWYAASYWFAWAAFYPESGIFPPGPGGGADITGATAKE